MLPTLVCAARRGLQVSLKPAKRVVSSRTSKPSNSRSVVAVYERSLLLNPSRGICRSIPARNSAKGEAEAPETESSETNQELDFSVLQPSAAEPVSVEAKKRQAGRVFTSEQKARSARTMAKWRTKVLEGITDRDRLGTKNESLILATKEGRFEDVVDMWLTSPDWVPPVTFGALHCVLIALERLEDRNPGFPSGHFETALSQIYAKGLQPKLITFFILVDYFTKIAEYPRARQHYNDLMENIDKYLEDQAEARDDLLDLQKPIPENLQEPFYNLHQACQLESIEELKEIVEFFVVHIASANGTAGPLIKRRTLDTLLKQWHSTEIGKILPLRDAETILQNENQVLSGSLFPNVEG